MNKYYVTLYNCINPCKYNKNKEFGCYCNKNFKNNNNTTYVIDGENHRSSISIS